MATSENLRRILATNIKKQRKVLGISQERLAENANVSWQTINSIECHRTWVSDKTLENLASALQVETYQLLLPIKIVDKQIFTQSEALHEILKIKRNFDMQFNETLNLVHLSG